MKVVSLEEDGTLEVLSLDMHREEAMWGYNEKCVVFKPTREVSLDIDPASTLILDL